jgi:ubiquinone/menaquinone biosynthesis C-methylase UbiE
LTVPIAQSCKNATGVDFTLQAIESARKYSRESGCENIEFIHSDLLEFVKGRADKMFDIVVFTEVTFFLPTYKEVLKEIHRILKPEGVAFISFRSQFFNILHSVQRRKWDSVRMAINEREGYLWGGHTWFSWHTQEDIQALLKRNGYSDINCVGIGVFSGIEGDPLSYIARPSLLGVKDKVCLQELELRLSKEYVNNGRYILAMARK